LYALVSISIICGMPLSENVKWRGLVAKLANIAYGEG
jgi:hypothetical protein